MESEKQQEFHDIILLIKQSQCDAVKAVNKELIDLYWNVGHYISVKIESSIWGESVVKELAEYLNHTEPTLKGFSDKNLWRMKQFYETYKDNSKLSAVAREIHPDITKSFRDNYVLEFLGLPKHHSESELQKGLISQMKDFILELGKDFLFVGEEYRIQVGNSDFYIDLLFYHRGLQCLIAFRHVNAFIFLMSSPL